MAASGIVPTARNHSLYLLLARRLARSLRPIQLNRIVPEPMETARSRVRNDERRKDVLYTIAT
jgi:hypothetical protein